MENITASRSPLSSWHPITVTKDSIRYKRNEPRPRFRKLRFVPFGKLISKSNIVGQKLVGISGDLTGMYRALKGSTNLSARKAAQTLGDLGAVAVGKKLGLRAVDDFPIRYHGIDGIMQKGNRIFIIEAKGGGSGALSTTVTNGQQLSKKWINNQIDILHDKDYTKWAERLEKARDNQQLFAMKVHTPLDSAGNALDPKFDIRFWNNLGADTFVP